MGLRQLCKWVFTAGLFLISSLNHAQSLIPNLPQLARMFELESRDLYLYCEMHSGEISSERRALKDFYRLAGAARSFAISLETKDFKKIQKEYIASILTWPELTCFMPSARSFDSLDHLYRKMKAEIN